MKRKKIILSIIFILIFEPLAFIYAQSRVTGSAEEASIRDGRKPVKLLKMFGQGQFNSINNIYVSPKGIIYISDASDCTVKAFNMRNEFLFSFGQVSGSKLQSIMELSSDNDGNVYVADYDQDLVNVYNSNGKYLFNIKPETEMQKKLKGRGVSGMAVNSRRDIYIADSANGRIEVRDINLKYKYQIDIFKNKDGKKLELISPAHPRINSHDELYVIDPLISSVHCFDARGNYLSSFGTYLSAPSGLAIDRYDRVYVIDMRFCAVLIYDREGKFLYALSDENGKEIYLPYPTGLAVDNNGYIYVGCNDGGWGVKVFKYIPAWGEGK
ncbi:MAG: NHL repeat-containing protein [bacterium]|nr:NHL repeat-containing protein [bacterium]